MISAIDAKQKTNSVTKIKEINERNEERTIARNSKEKANKDFPDILIKIEKDIIFATNEGRNSIYVFSGYSEYDKYLYQLIDNELSKLGYKVYKETAKFDDYDNGTPIINIEW